MPIKVQIIIDHIIDGDELTLSRDDIKRSISEAHPTIAGGQLKINDEEDPNHQPLHQTASSDQDPATLLKLQLVVPTTSTFDLRLQHSSGITQLVPDIGWHWSVLMLKARIAQTFTHYALERHQKMQIGACELEDEEILGDKMASSNVVIKLCLRSKFQVLVKRLTGMTSTFDVTTTDTTMDLKILIADKEGISPHDPYLRLICGGRQLEDHLTLGFQGVVKESTVHLIGRLRGCGCGCGKNNYVEVASDEERSVVKGFEGDQ